MCLGGAPCGKAPGARAASPGKTDSSTGTSGRRPDSERSLATSMRNHRVRVFAPCALPPEEWQGAQPLEKAAVPALRVGRNIDVRIRGTKRQVKLLPGGGEYRVRNYRG